MAPNIIERWKASA